MERGELIFWETERREETEPNPYLTLEEIYEWEPALVEIEKMCAMARRKKGRCVASDYWYGYDDKPRLKEILPAFVGWHARVKALRTSQAWDKVFHRLYHEVLP